MKSIWLIGNPISHSLSPIFQTAALEHLNIEAKYSIREVGVRELAMVTSEMHSTNTLGANITIPYKTEIMQYLGEIDPFAKEVGAVNTVLVERSAPETRLVGYNTDVSGIIDPILNTGFSLSKSRAMLIGTGGAALSAFQALENLNIADIDIVARNMAAAVALADRPSRMSIKVYDLANITHETFATLINQSDAIIQATPVGMSSGLAPNKSPVPQAVLRDGLTGKSKGTLIFDLVYAPRETLFLHLARMYGNHETRYIEGLEMLLHQGAESFKIWTGHPAPISVMRASLGLADV